MEIRKKELNMYSLEDQQEILRLFKVGNATQHDMNSIYDY